VEGRRVHEQWRFGRNPAECRKKFQRFVPGVLKICTSSAVSKKCTWSEDQKLMMEFENNYFTDVCSGSEAGSYLRLIDFVHHSTLGLGVIQKQKKMDL